MIAVAIETSRRIGSVAVLAEGRSLERLLTREKSHASDLLPKLEELLAPSRSRAGRLTLDRVIVGTGPGSYTGLRVGIATAQGLARASEAPILGLSSFEALVFGALAPGEEAGVALDARAGRFYFGRYRRLAAEVEVQEMPRALLADELRSALGSCAIVLAEEGMAEAAGLDARTRERLRTDAIPRAGALLALGMLRPLPASPASSVEPLYLHRFGAS